MANEISIYEPRYLAEVVRTTPLVRTFFLDNYFTNVKTFATKSVDIDVVKGDRRMASFVHPLVGGQVLKNEGYQTESFTPPLINPLTVTTANDALERMPGEDLYSGMTPEERAAKQLIEDYQRLNDADPPRRVDGRAHYHGRTDSHCRPRREQGDRLRFHQQGDTGRHEEMGRICR